MTSNKSAGIAALVWVGFNFALFSCIARFLQNDLGVYHQLWIRLPLMALLGLSIPAGRATLYRLCSLPIGKIVLIIIQAFLIYPLGALTWVAAVQLSPLATVAFITALPTEAVWGTLIFRDRLSFVGFLFLLFSMVGLWFVVTPGELGLGTGEILALISSLSFSLGVMLSGRWSSGLSRTESNIALGFFGSGMVAVLGVINEPIPTTIPLGSAIVLVASSALILLNFNLLAFGFQRLSGSLAGTVLMSEVIFAAAIGAFVFGEALPSSTLYGGVLIVGSAIGLTLNETRSRANQDGGQISNQQFRNPTAV